MCLAYPGKIISVEGNEGVVDFEGARRRVRLDLVDAKKGDYVLVHTGFAIEKIDPKKAKKTMKLLKLVFSI